MCASERVRIYRALYKQAIRKPTGKFQSKTVYIYHSNNNGHKAERMQIWQTTSRSLSSQIKGFFSMPSHLQKKKKIKASALLQFSHCLDMTGRHTLTYIVGTQFLYMIL